MLRNWILCLFVAVSCVALTVNAALFEMKDPRSDKPLVIELTDEAKIKQARAILSGEEKNTIHVMGRIRKNSKSYNPNYSFHLDPDTITFFDLAIEVCDSSLSYLEDHLDEACGAFLPGCFYCPWVSTLIKEVK